MSALRGYWDGTVLGLLPEILVVMVASSLHFRIGADDNGELYWGGELAGVGHGAETEAHHKGSGKTAE